MGHRGLTESVNVGQRVLAMRGARRETRVVHSVIDNMSVWRTVAS